MIDFIYNFITAHPWILIAGISHLVIVGTVAYLILLERKVASWVQDRIGPNRVGPYGLLQPIADGIKFLFKEDYAAKGVDKILFTVAPGIMIVVIILSIAVLPWGGIHQVTKTLNVPAKANATALAASAVPGTGSIAGETETVTDPADPTRQITTVTQVIPDPSDPSKTIKVANPYIHTVPAEVDNGIELRAAKSTVTITYRYPFQAANLNIGVLFILGVLSLAVYGVVIGGWASNNKYSFLGALRATAQMVSYEIPLGLCVLCIVFMYGTLDLGEMVDKQAHMWGHVLPAWNVFCQPITFLMFVICIHAEANRAPFDMAEAEQELVGGYHTEYSSMRFALFFLAEYCGMITTSAVCVALFFGGWHLPGLTGGVDAAHPSVTTSLGLCLLRAAVFFGKTIVIIFIFLWTRWSLPRFRFDQLMMLAWRAMIPMSLGLMLVTAIAVYLGGGVDINSHVGGKMALLLLGGNVLVLVVTMGLSLILPAAPETNRRLKVVGSRFSRLPALPRQARCRYGRAFEWCGFQPLVF